MPFSICLYTCKISMELYGEPFKLCITALKLEKWRLFKLY